MQSQSIKKKIFLNLFVTTSVLLPFTVGINFLAIGWAVSSINIIFVGLVSLLVSGGMLANRFTFHLDEIAKKTYQELYDQKIKEQKLKTTTLYKKLQKTDDEKDEDLLKNIKTIYDGFLSDVRDNKLSEYLSPTTASEVDQIFESCIRKLEFSYEMYQTSKTLVGKSKDDIIAERNKILVQIEEEITHFIDIVSRIRALRLKNSIEDQSEVKRRLSLQLKAAERTQIEMEKIKNPGDISRFKEFLND